MKLFLVLLGLIFGLPVFASSGSGNVSNVVGECGYSEGAAAGSAVTTTFINAQSFFPATQLGSATNIEKTLIAGNVNTTAGAAFAFFDFLSDSVTQYTPASGKKFYTKCICYNMTNGSSQGHFTIGYSTATFTNGATASGLTGVSYWGSAPGGSANQFVMSAYGSGQQSRGCYMLPGGTGFSNGKYIFWTSQDSFNGHVLLVGTEQ